MKNLTDSALLKKSTTFYVNRRFIGVFTCFNPEQDQFSTRPLPNPAKSRVNFPLLTSFQRKFPCPKLSIPCRKLRCLEAEKFSAPYSKPTPCRLAENRYFIYSQIPSISGGSFHLPPPEDASFRRGSAPLIMTLFPSHLIRLLKNILKS